MKKQILPGAFSPRAATGSVCYQHNGCVCTSTHRTSWGMIVVVTEGKKIAPPGYPARRFHLPLRGYNPSIG